MRASCASCALAALSSASWRICAIFCLILSMVAGGVGSSCGLGGGATGPFVSQRRPVAYTLPALPLPLRRPPAAPPRAPSTPARAIISAIAPAARPRPLNTGCRASRPRLEVGTLRLRLAARPRATPRRTARGPASLCPPRRPRPRRAARRRPARGHVTPTPRLAAPPSARHLQQRRRRRRRRRPGHERAPGARQGARGGRCNGARAPRAGRRRAPGLPAMAYLRPTVEKFFSFFFFLFLLFFEIRSRPDLEQLWTHPFCRTQASAHNKVKKGKKKKK